MLPPLKRTLHWFRFIKLVRADIHFQGKVKTLWDGYKISKNFPRVLTKQMFLLSSVKTSEIFLQNLWPFQKTWTLKCSFSSVRLKNWISKSQNLTPQPPLTSTVLKSHSKNFKKKYMGQFSFSNTCWKTSGLFSKSFLGLAEF